MKIQPGTIVALRQFGNIGIVTKKASETKKEWWVDYRREYSRTGPKMANIVASEENLIPLLNPELDSLDKKALLGKDSHERFSKANEIIQRYLPVITAKLAIKLDAIKSS